MNSHVVGLPSLSRWSLNHLLMPKINRVKINQHQAIKTVPAKSMNLLKTQLIPKRKASRTSLNRCKQPNKTKNNKESQNHPSKASITKQAAYEGERKSMSTPPSTNRNQSDSTKTIKSINRRNNNWARRWQFKRTRGWRRRRRIKLPFLTSCTVKLKRSRTRVSRSGRKRSRKLKILSGRLDKKSKRSSLWRKNSTSNKTWTYRPLKRWRILSRARRMMLWSSFLRQIRVIWNRSNQWCLRSKRHLVEHLALSSIFWLLVFLAGKKSGLHKLWTLSIK